MYSINLQTEFQASLDAWTQWSQVDNFSVK